MNIYTFTTFVGCPKLTPMGYRSLSSLNFECVTFLEGQYERYRLDPSAVLPCWQDLFDSDPKLHQLRTLSEENSATDDFHVFELIRAYRTYGHLMAQVNPIATKHSEVPRELRLETLGLRPSDLQRLFPTCGLLLGSEAPLSAIIEWLQNVYCGRIGIEYMGTQSPELESWLQRQVEPSGSQPKLSIDQKRMILQQLNRSELFELFLHKNYTGQKRFSLEGAETLIPMLSAIMEQGAGLGYKEFVLGMAHRGRLNVLSNILDKSYGEIFSEFEEGYIPESFEGSGDVKYHKGFVSDIEVGQKKRIKVSLTPNPSHLESVYPVVEGQVRAKQVKCKDDKNRVLPIIIHGDAAIAGQGVVYETMQMYSLAGYSNGGTIHLVINNQIGFTTLPKDGRSTRYCTDIARTFSAPVFHINAEDPEGCVYATNLAMELRHRFHCDVFLDLVCYRKFGHNETDEPAFTQPLEYQMIRKKKPIREIYCSQLISQGVLEREVAQGLEAEFNKSLHEAKAVGKGFTQEPHKRERAQPIDIFSLRDTGVEMSVLQEVAKAFCSIPDQFNLHPKLHHLLETRLSMVHGEIPVDWGMAEHLAMATLLWEGFHVRLTGQDTRRGTFSHRHAMWMDQALERKFFPLSKLKAPQGRFDVFNSLLSEYASMAFEFGYSVAYPEALVIWEGQFGDFSNGAQVVIDQYLSTAEQKWGVRCGLVLLLPHGYEGQGPEHTSARMERFLSLSGDDNMCVVNPTTPVQLFHLLRRQLLLPLQKPLIVFTPKGLLRHSSCVSAIEEFYRGSFQEVLDDPLRPNKVRRLIFCSGRVYYDLIAEREKRKVSDIAIVRLEQLYPLHLAKLKEVLASYSAIREFIWVQEEAHNMGAWSFIQPHIQKLLGDKTLAYIGRERSASPATGSFHRHQKEYITIMEAVFSGKRQTTIKTAKTS